MLSGLQTSRRHVPDTNLSRELAVDELRKGKLFSSEAVRGLRMTHWELEKKAEQVLAERYGAAAVKKMLILEYEKKVTGILPGLGQRFAGVVFRLLLPVGSDGH